MSTLSLRLPNSLHDTARSLAKQDSISINQFITVALAEKISALMTNDYLAERAKRGSKEEFDAVMAKIPDIAPLEYDRLKG
ncbi:MAG: type II toxin-antitoxin system HicB family antitoxin [Chloroflexi bacterium]|nr:type II toxin-antitoxin system HicB family antitoxin [Chloroflexota bacterium]